MNDRRRKKGNSGPLSTAERHAYERLKSLYKISKLLSSFDDVEQAFREIFRIGGETFPVATAVLIDREDPAAATWLSYGSAPETIACATLNAVEVYSYLTGITVQPESLPQPVQGECSSRSYVVLPLIVDNLPAFGALQIEGSRPLNEEDLEFINALANLIAVALDRFNKSKQEREANRAEVREGLARLSHSKEKVADLETERELREAFVSLLTHDLRTPLSSVLLLAQLISRSSEEPEKCRILAERIIGSITRADQMIGNLLDANLIRSGEKLPLIVEPFDLPELVKGTLDELAAIHSKRFVYHGPERFEGYWDRKGLRRIVENLCNNAVKYGSGQTPITVTVRPVDQEVEISVQNRGSVISAEDQKSLFQQFRRGEKAQGSRKKGWGIGLALVRGVAEAHGGRVTVTSELSKGTTFTVRLPNDARPVVFKKGA